MGEPARYRKHCRGPVSFLIWTKCLLLWVIIGASQVALVVKNPPADAGDIKMRV